MDGIAAVVCLLGLPFLVIAIVASVIEKRPTYPSNPTCPRCRASLPAAGECPACPGCGLPKARIARVTCPACRYDLIGTLDAAHCPECGRPDPVYGLVVRSRLVIPAMVSVRAAAIVAAGITAIAVHAVTVDVAMWVWRVCHRYMPGHTNFGPRFIGRFSQSYSAGSLITAATSAAAAYAVVLIIPGAVCKRPVPMARMLLILLAAWLGLACGLTISFIDRGHAHARLSLWTTILPACTTAAITLYLVVAAGLPQAFVAWRRRRRSRD